MGLIHSDIIETITLEHSDGKTLKQIYKICNPDGSIECFHETRYSKDQGCYVFAINEKEYLRLKAEYLRLKAEVEKTDPKAKAKAKKLK